MISSILKKVSLPHTLATASPTLLSNKSLKVTASNQQLEKNAISAELSITKTSIAPENDEDDEEEEIDDDEEAI